MIAIIDYDIGNVAAVRNILTRLGYNSVITSDAHEIDSADRIILPGTGSFDFCMANLSQSGLIPVLEQKALIDKVPLLGICVGAQLLGRGSEEGRLKGLSWLAMDVRRLQPPATFAVPHLGWAFVDGRQSSHPLLGGLEDNEAARFYFAHSYYMQPDKESDWLFSVTYGTEFCAAAARDNIAAVQFHPEKSHRFGKALLKRFALWETK